MTGHRLFTAFAIAVAMACFGMGAWGLIHPSSRPPPPKCEADFVYPEPGFLMVFDHTTHAPLATCHVDDAGTFDCRRP